ncbi:MAG: PF20097 family protein [Eubacteriales bacterium]|nr:PF20097 family protein [Eubacteriales bacterium]
MTSVVIDDKNEGAEMMKCPECGKDMKPGYLQTAKILAFNKNRHRISMNSECEDDVMIARKAFAGTDFPGFICKDCGLILFDYKNGMFRF